MNIEKVVEELRAERDRLNGIITTLERLDASEGTPGGPKRRGRKFMDKEGRKEVSERMKRYWADRRSGRDSDRAEHASAAPASVESIDRAAAPHETRTFAA